MQDGQTNLETIDISHLPAGWWVRPVAAILVPLLMVSVPLIGWAFSISSDIKVIKVQLETQINDRYRASEASADFRLRDERLVNLEIRLDRYIAERKTFRDKVGGS